MKSDIRKIVLTTSVIVISAAVCLWVWVPDPLLAAAYGKLQTPFFSGFLALGGFLLSLKTSVLIKLKESLFDSKAYGERVQTANETNGPDSRIKRYEPIKLLGRFLIWSVLGCLLTALMQVTVGFIPYKAAYILCICSATLSMTLVLFSWYHIQKNLGIWFDVLEEGNPKE